LDATRILLGASAGFAAYDVPHLAEQTTLNLFPYWTCELECPRLRTNLCDPVVSLVPAQAPQDYIRCVAFTGQHFRLMDVPLQTNGSLVVASRVFPTNMLHHEGIEARVTSSTSILAMHPMPTHIGHPVYVVRGGFLGYGAQVRLGCSEDAWISQGSHVLQDMQNTFGESTIDLNETSGQLLVSSFERSAWSRGIARCRICLYSVM
jgi:hypothetical protein